MERLEALAGRKDPGTDGIFPLMGIYDVFSATIAAKHFDGIFAPAEEVAAKRAAARKAPAKKAAAKTRH